MRMDISVLPLKYVLMRTIRDPPSDEGYYKAYVKTPIFNQLKYFKMGLGLVLSSRNGFYYLHYV